MLFSFVFSSLGIKNRFKWRKRAASDTFHLRVVTVHPCQGSSVSRDTCVIAKDGSCIIQDH